VGIFTNRRGHSLAISTKAVIATLKNNDFLNLARSLH
jgi:hypothetical protein